jgi:hypothetical protein
MDPVTLAGAAVALLGPYLARIGGRAADRAGEAIADAALPRLGELLQALRRRFAPGSYEGGVLEGVAQRPDSQARRRALADTLAEELAEDPRFAGEVERLVADIRAAGGVRTDVGVIEGPAAFGGNVVQRGKYVAGHDLVVKPDPERDRG